MVKGFFFAAAHSGIKKRDLDLGIINCPEGASVAALTTTNKFQSPSVKHTREFIKSAKKAKILVVNSGNANALTGESGYDDILKITSSISDKFKIEQNSIIMLSTGIIGKRLPVDLINHNIPDKDAFTADSYDKFAKAILTTDTTTKIAQSTLEINGEAISFLGIAKGSGMINPHMATMHAIILTDAAIPQGILCSILNESTDKSFNKITVDGDCSTNDTTLLMASNEINVDIADKIIMYKIKKKVEEISVDLAKKIILDGEGATKFVELYIEGASSKEEARSIFDAIANSMLVKSAIFGENPNFGRILVAAGTVESSIIPEKVELYIGEHLLVKNYAVIDFDKQELNDYMKNKNISITLNLNNGNNDFTGWTTDLSHDYVKINAEYN